MPTTIKDIAARLGISHITVSRALRGFPYVNEELRRRIHETAREMNYRPNALARGLKGMRTQLVGLIIPDLLNDFYASVATLLQATLSREGYRVLLGVSGNDPACELDYLHAMREERVEGVIWAPWSWHPEIVKEYQTVRVPLIQFGRRVSDQLDAVLPDDERGAEEATKHLMQLGHRRIGLIVGPTELSSGASRLSGFQRALQAGGIALDDSLIKIGRFDRRWGREAAQELLDLPSPPTAILAASSELLIGALQVLDARRVAVPDRMSLVGFSNPDWYSLWRPPITTMAFSTEEAASLAVDTILDRIRERQSGNHANPCTVRYRLQLLIRGSTASPPPAPSPFKGS